MNFHTFQKKLNTFLATYPLPTSDESPYKLPLSDAIFCGEDTPRNRIFRKAIKQAIKERKKRRLPWTHPIVLDAGAGSGCLGLMALILGAKHCMFVEHNPHTLKLCQAVVEHFGYSDQATFLLGDATTLIPPTKFDLLVTETFTCDPYEEDFIAIANHLRHYMRRGHIIIPAHVDFTITPMVLEAQNTRKDFFKTKKSADQKTWPSTTLSFNAYQHINLSDSLQNTKISQSHKTTYTHLHITGTITLYGPHTITSGDSISFFNERVIKKLDIRSKMI